MAAYRIFWKPSAAKSLGTFPRKDQKRIATKVDALANNPFPTGTKKLSGEENLFRVRVGDYRIIYQVRERVLLLLVVKVGRRKEVYRRFS